MKYLLVLVLIGQPFGHRYIFDTLADCDAAGSIFINMAMGHFADASAQCYEWENGKTGEKLAGQAFGCIKGYAPHVNGGCVPTAP